MTDPTPADPTTPLLASRDASAAAVEALNLLMNAATSNRHTVQWMPEPLRFEVIYAGPGPFPNSDPRSGELEATVFIESDGALRLVREQEGPAHV